MRECGMPVECKQCHTCRFWLPDAVDNAFKARDMREEAKTGWCRSGWPGDEEHPVKMTKCGACTDKDSTCGRWCGR